MSPGDGDRTEHVLEARGVAATGVVSWPPGSTPELFPPVAEAPSTPPSEAPHDTDVPDGAPAGDAGGLLEADPAEPKVAASDPRFETGDDPRIPPGKMYFKIGEVAKIARVKAYVLRYWETEFPWVRPAKTSSRQRLYRRQDIAVILQIKRLRYDQQLTIAAAKDFIRRARGGGEKKERPRSETARPRRSNVTAAAAARQVAAAVPEVERTQLGLGFQSHAARNGELARSLAEMRRAVLDMLEAVEE